MLPQTEKYLELLKDDSLTLSQFMQKLNNLFPNQITDNFTDQYRNISYKLKLTHELEKIQNTHEGLDVCVNKTLDSVKFHCKDNMDNKHYFIVEFEKDMKVKIKSHSLPEIKLLTQQFTDLNEAINAFNKCLCDLDEYLEIMNILDSNCWIIDPINPTSKDNYRRIVINDDITALITIDIHCSNKPPHIKLLGLNKFTNPFLINIQKRINKWDSENSFLLNLLQIFDLTEFPYKSETESNEQNQQCETECCICFASRDENNLLPSIMCEKCNQHYHPICLYQWLSAVSNNLQHFNTIHGECPNCSNAISCPVVNNN